MVVEGLKEQRRVWEHCNLFFMIKEQVSAPRSGGGCLGGFIGTSQVAGDICQDGTLYLILTPTSVSAVRVFVLRDRVT